METVNDILIGLHEVRTALTADFGVWWVLAPLVVLWVLMEIYFGEYKQEQLGFSSALANGFTLFWVSLTSFRFSAVFTDSVRDERFYLLGFFVLYAVFVVYISFTHRLTGRAVHIIAGPTLIYFFSVLSVLWGQQLLSVSREVFFTLVVLFFSIFLLFYFLKKRLGLRGDIEWVRLAGHEEGQ